MSTPFTYQGFFLDEVALTSVSTVSVLYFNGQVVCYILEDGAREPKKHGHTRIPAGEYDLVAYAAGPLSKRLSAQFKVPGIPMITGVAGFSAILFHPGNTIDDTAGCLLTGHSARWGANHALEVSHSVIAFGKLMGYWKQALASGITKICISRSLSLSFSAMSAGYLGGHLPISDKEEE